MVAPAVDASRPLSFAALVTCCSTITYGTNRAILAQSAIVSGTDLVLSVPKDRPDIGGYLGSERMSEVRNRAGILDDRLYAERLLIDWLRRVYE